MDAAAREATDWRRILAEHSLEVTAFARYTGDTATKVEDPRSRGRR
jgi:hypothetical protein